MTILDYLRFGDALYGELGEVCTLPFWNLKGSVLPELAFITFVCALRKTIRRG